jgi:hypothetical protein
LLLLFPAPLLT